jgi:pimeloyl-ACP methyl ester carboxylesterase
MLPSRLLLGLLAGLAALLATAPAHAAFPGTPGRVAYLDNTSPEMPLMVWTPAMGQGSADPVGIDTFHWQETDKVPMTIGFPSAPVWSPDGTRLAFAAKVPDPGIGGGATHTAIFTWTLRSHAITRITTPPDGKPGCSCSQQLGYLYADYAPAWSPDGKRIAFVREQGSGKDEGVHGTDGGNVRTVPATGGASTELTHKYGEQMYFSLAWGGDPTEGGSSALLGYHGGNAAGQFSLQRIDPESGASSNEIAGVEAAKIIDFDVSPDGLYVGYATMGGQLFDRQLGGGNTVALGKSTTGRMRYSPTGNGPLHIGSARIPGQGDWPRGGLVERQTPDAGGDQWPEDPQDRWVDGWMGPGLGKYGFAHPGRSSFDVQPQRLPIIDIPGFGGSEIRCGGETLWGPSVLGMGAKLKAMELADDGKTNAGCAGAAPTADPDDPTGFVMTVLGDDIYQSQAKFITDIAPGQRGWRFSWDWRKPPAESLDRLDALVTKALGKDFAMDQGLDRVVMYGHSYGGLLMREYQQLHPDRLARVLTVGAPFWGATKPLNFATFGMENPLSGVADLDTLLPNAAAKAFARNLSGLYWLVPSDHYGPWLKVGAAQQDQAGVRDYFTGTAGGNGALVDAGLAWHRKFDGFSTSQGLVESRAVVGTGLPTIEAIDVSDKPQTDGELQVSLHLGQGDVTVPIRSASQGPLGTHTPLGDPVHVQAVCGIGHMKLGGNPKVTEPYTEYLLQGRTPRKTEGACEMEATAIVVRNLQSHPGGGALRARTATAAPGGGLSLDAAAAEGRIQLLRYPGQPIAIVDERHPVTLDVAGAAERVELTITRYRGEQELPAVTYRPDPGAVQVEARADGPVVTVDGRPVAGEVAGGGGGGDQPGAGAGAPGVGEPPAAGGDAAAAGAGAPAAGTTPAPGPGAASTGKAIIKPKPKAKPKTVKRCKTIKKKVRGHVRTVKRCTTVKVKPHATKPKARRRTG